MRRRIIWITGVVAFLVAFLLAWKFEWGAVSGPAGNSFSLTDPLKNIEFPDGYRLEILGVGEGEWTDGSVVVPPSGWKLQRSSRGTFSMVTDRDHVHINFDHLELDSKLVGIRTEVDGDDLLLSARVVGPSGSAVGAWEMFEDDLQVEIWDGVGDWHRGYGFQGYEEDPEKRGVFGFRGWPRSGSDLRFRASRPGHPPQEFKLPNPNAGTLPAAWTGAPLPQSKIDPDWEIKLLGVREVVEPGFRVLVPEFEFVSKVAASPPSPWEPVKGYPLEVAGDMGTRSCVTHVTAKKGALNPAFPVPPGESVFQFRYRVQYGRTFPYHRADAVMLLEATLAPGGKTLDVTRRHAVSGITSFEVSDVEKQVSPDDPPMKISAELKGEWHDAAAQAAFEGRIGKFSEIRGVVFVNGAPRSSGDSWTNNSSRSTSWEKTSFNVNFEWRGELNPGDQLEIGVVAEKPDEIHLFTVDRADFTP